MDNETIKIIISLLSLSVSSIAFYRVHRTNRRYNKIMKEYKEKILER